MKSDTVYFGGSRHTKNIDLAQVAAVVAAVIANGTNIHVGCQSGADQAVIQAVPTRRIGQLHIFAVTTSIWALKPNQRHLSLAHNFGANMNYSAGGNTAPMPARFLLRSLAALAGCQSAVFFAPGAGSLSVARHALAAGTPVFIFATTAPTLPVPAHRATFQKVACWQYTPATQPTLF